MGNKSIIFELSDGLELYNNEFHTVNDIEYEFIREKEGKIIDNGDSPNQYSFRYTVELIWYIKDKNETYYKCELSEYGDHKNDLTLEPNGSLVFTETKKVTKQKRDW